MQKIPAVPEHLRGSALLRKDAARTDLFACAGELRLRDPLFERARNDVADGVVCLFGILGIDARIHRQMPAFAVKGGIGVHRIGKSELFPHFLKEAGTHAAADDGVHDLQRLHALVRAADAGISDGKMHLLDLLVFEKALPQRENGLVPRTELSAFHAAKIFFGQFFRLIERDGARKADDDIFGAVELGFIFVHGGFGKAPHVFRGTEDVASVALFTVYGMGQNVETEVFGRILVHGNFFADDFFFPDRFLFGKSGMQEKIA